jgi:ATP-dependent DNA ligase
VLHEIKHDGFRMIVQRDGDRVRLFTRNGHDWSDGYPSMVQAAPQLRRKQFGIDGEAVVGVDGRRKRKSLICIRPVLIGSRAVALMGICTHFWSH